MVKVLHDSITKAFTVFALITPIYLATFEMGLDVLFPAFLLLAGWMLTLYINKKIAEDPSISSMEQKEIGKYTLIALAGIALAGVFPLLPSGLSVTGVMMYGLLMAVAEEHFFRGGILSFLLARVPSVLAILGSAAAFAMYHLSIGTSTEFLIFTFGAGGVLAWVAVRTGRLSPCILAHVIWNVLGALQQYV